MIADWVLARLTRRRDRHGAPPADVKSWVDWLKTLSETQLALAPASENVHGWVSYTIEDPDWSTG